MPDRVDKLQRLQQDHADQLFILQLDVASVDSIAAWAKEIKQHCSNVDVRCCSSALVCTCCSARAHSLVTCCVHVTVRKTV